MTARPSTLQPKPSIGSDESGHSTEIWLECFRGILPLDTLNLDPREVQLLVLLETLYLRFGMKRISVA